MATKWFNSLDTNSSQYPLINYPGCYYFSSLSSLNMHWHHRSCACCLKGRTASWIPLPLEQADISHCGNLTRFFFLSIPNHNDLLLLCFTNYLLIQKFFLQLSIFCGFSVSKTRFKTFSQGDHPYITSTNV